MLNMHRNGVYRMPAEWETQKSTWIAWPHNKEDWPGKFNEIPRVFGKIISELSKFQLVNILIKDESNDNYDDYNIDHDDCDDNYRKQND